jgi:hypothetical protein
MISMDYSHFIGIFNEKIQREKRVGQEEHRPQRLQADDRRDVCGERLFAACAVRTTGGNRSRRS